jgi:glycosyltransferase involved in cell wall biosynthesis
MSSRKVLFVSYAFPPTGGAGVQRAVKFVKYLPSYGWKPIVLTAANPSVPVMENDFQGDLDPQLRVLRARTWEPSYSVKASLAGGQGRSASRLRSAVRRYASKILQPDPQILWNRSAFQLAKRALAGESLDAIVVSGPPFSSFLLGCKLKKHFGVPLVLDFRDEWMLVGRYMENHQMQGSLVRRQLASMHRVLAAADAAIATTQASAAEIMAHCMTIAGQAGMPSCSPPRVCCIYNGFDPDDMREIGLPASWNRSSFTSSEDALSSERRLQIVYTGTLWNLTDIGPVVSSLEQLHVRSSQLASRIELVTVGRCTAGQTSLLDRLSSTSVRVTPLAYLPHADALRLAAKADLLLLLLAAEVGAERVVPAKLFEYLALRRPVLAVVPTGETADLLRPFSQATLFHPTQISEMTEWLHQQVTGLTAKGSEQGGLLDRHQASEIQETLLSRFARPQLAYQLAELLDSITIPSSLTAPSRIA